MANYFLNFVGFFDEMVGEGPFMPCRAGQEGPASPWASTTVSAGEARVANYSVLDESAFPCREKSDRQGGRAQQLPGGGCCRQILQRYKLWQESVKRHPGLQPYGCDMDGHGGGAPPPLTTVRQRFLGHSVKLISNTLTWLNESWKSW